MGNGIQITPQNPGVGGVSTQPSAQAARGAPNVPANVPANVRGGGGALRAEARRAPGLPPAAQRSGLRERLSRDMSELNALRPRVGEGAYAMARAANLMSRLDAGMIELPAALKELKELHAICAGLSGDGTEALHESLEAVEREVLATPLYELAHLAEESGAGNADRFRDFATQLHEAMDILRLSGNDPVRAQEAFTRLQSLHAQALVDDSLYAALPHPRGDKLRAEWSAGLQTLLHAAHTKLSLLNDAQMLRNDFALANAFARAAEEASRPGFDATAFKEGLRPVLEAYGLSQAEGFFHAELQALQTENLSQRAALDMLHGLQEKLRGVVAGETFPQRVHGLGERIEQAAASQFTRGAAGVAELRFVPATGDPAAFLDRTADICIRRAMGEPRSEAEWNTLVKDMALLNLTPRVFDAKTLECAADLRLVRAAWREDSSNSDALVQVALDAELHLEKLEEGPDKTLLRRELEIFRAFRTDAEARIGQDIARCLDEAEKVLQRTPPDPKAIKEMETRLESALARLEQNKQAGNVLKGELRAKVSEMQNRLVLKRLDGELSVLRSARATPLSLQELQKKYEGNPAAQKRIQAFSEERAAELREEIKRASLPAISGGAAARAELERLEAQAGRLLLAGDQAGIRNALADKRQAFARALSDRAFTALHPDVTESLSPDEQFRLRRLLGHCLGSEALVSYLNDTPDAAKALVAIAPGAEASARVDDLLLQFPLLDQAALEIKLALVGDDARAQTKATEQHVDARLRRQAFHFLDENGARDLLAVLGIKGARELSFERLAMLLAYTVAQSGEAAPGFIDNAFHTLLVQSAWSAFVQEGGHTGSDEDLRAFQTRLPEPLRSADLQVLRGVFRLGPLSGADMREAARFASAGGKLFAAEDVGRLMDRFCEHSAPLRAQRALTVMLRNMLDSAGIEYDPRDDNAGAYAKALAAGLKKRADDPATSHEVADACRRAIGLLSKASGLSYEGQVGAALQHIQAASGAMARIQRLEREILKARGVLEEASRQLPPPDWQALKFKPGEEFAKDASLRLTQMQDPWRVLRHQEVLDPESQTIDGGKIRGEPLALQILAFRDVLDGRVDGLETYEKQLAALRGISIPKKINFKRMLGDPGSKYREEPEAKAFREKLEALRQLKPGEPGFAEKFRQLKEAILGDIARYNLDAKAELILALKDSNASVRGRESGGGRSGVSHAGAMRHGLKKIGLGGPESPPSADAEPNPADRLRHHFMAGEHMFLRGRGVNLNEADRRALREMRTLVERKQGLLEPALKDLSSHSRVLLEESARMAALQAFVALGYATFAEAEEALLGENPQFRAAIEKNLQDNFGVDPEFASFLLSAFVTQPVQRAKLGAGAYQPGAVFERFCTEALPSAEVTQRQRAVDRQLAAPVRQLVQAETNRRRFTNLLDQLEPNSAMDFSTGIRAEVKLGANPGMPQVSAAIGVAREKGFALGQNEEGQYELAIRGDFSGGDGVGTSALRGAVSGSLGVSVSESECLVFTFKSKEDAAAFLQKMSDSTWGPEDIFRHCLNIKKSDSLGARDTIAAQVEAGESKVMDNSPVGQPVFSAGFEISGNVTRKTETDAGKQTQACTSTVQGRIGVGLSVGRSGEETGGEALAESQRTAASGAASALAAPGDLEVGDERADGALNCTFSIAATRNSTVTRSTGSDTRGQFVSASHGTTLSFTGVHAEAQFVQYARNNLHLSERHIQAMREDIRRNGADGFTVQVEHELNPSAADRCRMLERSGSEGAQEAESLLKDERQYRLNSVTLEFKGRSASDGLSVGLSRGPVQVGVTVGATATETFRVVYEASASEGGSLVRGAA